MARYRSPRGAWGYPSPKTCDSGKGGVDREGVVVEIREVVGGLGGDGGVALDEGRGGGVVVAGGERGEEGELVVEDVFEVGGGVSEVILDIRARVTG